MEVKVNLELHAPGHCQDREDLSQWFKHLCKAVSIEPLEPLCPFCGGRLRNARCQCHEFDVRLQKFLSSYNKEDLHIGLKPEIPCATVFKISDMSSQIHITTFSGNLLSLFDYGTAACNRKQTWFVSQGNLDGQDLGFWLRQKGCETVYRCFSAQGMATCYSATYSGQAHLAAMDRKQEELSEEKKKCRTKLETAPQDTRSFNRIKQIEIQEEKLAKDRKKAEAFIQEYPEGLALSSGITINTRHRAWLVYGGNRALLREVGANYAIKQFEIRDDLKKGFEFVDFFGTIGNPTPQSEHIGIHDFKKRFSGDYYEFPGEFHLVLKPAHYAVWMQMAPKVKEWLRAFKKRKTGVQK